MYSKCVLRHNYQSRNGQILADESAWVIYWSLIKVVFGCYGELELFEISWSALYSSAQCAFIHAS